MQVQRVSSPLPEEAQCRICREFDDPTQLLTPCACKGTVGHVHKSCLLLWISHRIRTRRPIENCEVCGTKLQLAWRTKPLWHWNWKIALTSEERAKLNIFTFSYVVAAMDIARYFFEPARKRNNRSDKILKILLFLITSASWIFIFSQHGRFFYALWRRCKEQNMYIEVDSAPSGALSCSSRT